jgi:predicted nucleic acid-binding protein
VLFVDTSFLAGFILTRDSAHAVARALGSRLLSEPLCTSELILGETWTLLRKRVGHRHAMSWVDYVRAMPRIHIEPVDDAITSEAWAWLRIHDERPYTFVDATSFVLMRKLRITDALAFDGDFAAAGFNELRT